MREGEICIIREKYQERGRDGKKGRER